MSGIEKAVSQVKNPEEFQKFYHFNRALELADKIEIEKCTATDRQIVLFVREKLAGSLEISRDEMMILEEIYFALDPTGLLLPHQIQQLKNFVRKTAQEDCDSGHFKNLADALAHYGILEETGGVS